MTTARGRGGFGCGGGVGGGISRPRVEFYTRMNDKPKQFGRVWGVYTY